MSATSTRSWRTTPATGASATCAPSISRRWCRSSAPPAWSPGPRTASAATSSDSSPPHHTGYVHLIATRDDTRGTGLGRTLYQAFTEAARGQGAVRLKAITSVTNEGSIAFHRSLGFDARVVEDYDGPGRPRVVFTRDLL